MGFRTALNITLIFGGGSVLSWAFLSWASAGFRFEEAFQQGNQGGNFVLVVGLIGLAMTVAGLVSQVMFNDKKD